MSRIVVYKPTEVSKKMYQNLGLNAIREILLDAWYYLSQLGAGWPFKAPLAAFATFYTTTLGGDWLMMSGFYILTFVDLIFGTVVAIQRRQFSVRRFGKWVLKVCTYTACIIMVGFVNTSISRTGDFGAPFLNGVLVVIITTEVMSVFCNMDKAGLPVPAWLVKLISNIHEKTTDTLNQACGSKKDDDQGGPPEPD